MLLDIFHPCPRIELGACSKCCTHLVHTRVILPACEHNLTRHPHLCSHRPTDSPAHSTSRLFVCYTFTATLSRTQHTTTTQRPHHKTTARHTPAADRRSLLAVRMQTAVRRSCASRCSPKRHASHHGSTLSPGAWLRRAWCGRDCWVLLPLQINAGETATTHAALCFAMHTTQATQRLPRST